MAFSFSLQQMHIDSHEALGVLNTLFEILAPSSLRPVDMLLRSMFVTPDTMVSFPPHGGISDSALCGQPAGARWGLRTGTSNRCPVVPVLTVEDRTLTACDPEIYW